MIKMMFSALKNTALQGVKWHTFSAAPKHVKICGTTFGVSWQKHPFPPDFAVNFLVEKMMFSVLKNTAFHDVK